MKSKPLWMDGRVLKAYPKLDQNLKVDVLIIGGGITGVTTAQRLCQSGLSVALLERDWIGSGDTGHTTAHLTYMTDTRLSKLIHVCGEEHARMAWNAGKHAMDYIQGVCIGLDEEICLKVVPGYLVAAEDSEVEKEGAKLREEAEIAQRMGFDVEFLDSIPPTNKPGIRFANQMIFHPLRYLQAIAAEATKNGVRIFEQTNVTEFGENPNHVIANGHQVQYRYVVIATHVPLQGNRGTLAATLFQTKLASYSTYAMAARIPTGALEGMIWSDTAEPFNYFRIDQKERGDSIIFGGEDHKTGQVVETDECFNKLERSLRRIVKEFQPSHFWSGQVVETVDGLPYIGENSEGQFIATGFSGNGMTFGTIAGLMASDKIVGQENPWEKTFDPGRTELAAIPNYLKENCDFPYHLIKDRLSVAKDDPHPLPGGRGRVVKADCHYVAICRDAKGQQHELSAVCPHLGCIVAWNESENTWDCPCHGSRFAADGSLMAGPAEEDLKPIQSS